MFEVSHNTRTQAQISTSSSCQSTNKRGESDVRPRDDPRDSQHLPYPSSLLHGTGLAVPHDATHDRADGVVLPAQLRHGRRARALSARLRVLPAHQPVTEKRQQ